MLSPWHYLSSLCRQKRVLLIFCTFGSSFLLFNYSILSRNSSSPLYRSSSNPNTNPTSDGISKPQAVIQPQPEPELKTTGQSETALNVVDFGEKANINVIYESGITLHNNGNATGPPHARESRAYGKTENQVMIHHDTSFPGESIRKHKHEPVSSSTTVGSILYSTESPQSGTGTGRLQAHYGGNFPSTFQIPTCHTPKTLRRVQKRKKNLTVIENFIMSVNRKRCNESITYTTHGDFRYLDNLVHLVERWNGPVSLALYCPGTDLDVTLKIISYLKMCTDVGINEWVTFHLIYDVKFVKKPNTKISDIAWLDEVYRNGKWRNCSDPPKFNKFADTFRTDNGLLYPINIARNIARSAATTHFVLASDIELYPSINLIPSFISMLQRLQKLEEEELVSDYTKLRNKFTAVAANIVQKLLLFPSSTITARNNDNLASYQTQTQTSTLSSSSSFTSEQNGRHRTLSDPGTNRRHVFVLPVFEVKKEIVPCQVESKEQLVKLLRSRNAVLFHHSICPQCHTFPKFEEWKSRVRWTGAGSGSGAGIALNKNMSCGNGNRSISKKGVEIEMKIFHKAKRKYPYQLWEPIFIGTKDEPIYDERLSWEGLRDKMVSGYVMCALDYDFYILDNAFLVHRPGIRRVVHLVTKTVQSQDRLINYRIRSELLKKFGKHEECAL